MQNLCGAQADKKPAKASKSKAAKKKSGSKSKGKVSVVRLLCLRARELVVPAEACSHALRVFLQDTEPKEKKAKKEVIEEPVYEWWKEEEPLPEGTCMRLPPFYAACPRGLPPCKRPSLAGGKRARQGCVTASHLHTDAGKKWRFLEHNGVIFPPKYEPHGVRMMYDGKEVDLNPEQVAHAVLSPARALQLQATLLRNCSSQRASALGP